MTIVMTIIWDDRFESASLESLDNGLETLSIAEISGDDEHDLINMVEALKKHILALKYPPRSDDDEND